MRCGGRNLWVQVLPVRLVCSFTYNMHSAVCAGTPPPRDGVSLTATGMALTLMVFSIFCLRGILHGIHAWLVSFTGNSQSVFPICSFRNGQGSVLICLTTFWLQASLAGFSELPLAGWIYLTACVRWSSASGCWWPLIQPWATWLPLPLMSCQVQISPLPPLRKWQTVMLLMAPGQSVSSVRWC